MARPKARSSKYIPTTDISRFYRDLRCKVYGCGYNQLAGIPLLTDLLGSVLLEKVLDKGLNTNLDKVTIKLRRGLTITLYTR